MKKEITFSAKFETAEFDRSIDQMQRKLKEMYAPADQIRMQNSTAGRMDNMGMGGNMSRPGQEAYKQASAQGRRDIDQALARETQQQDRLSKIIERRSDKLKEMRAQQDNMTKGTQEELALKEKIARVEENNYRMRETYRGRDSAINQTMDARQQLSPKGIDGIADAYKNGGIRGAAANGIGQLRNMAGGTAGLIGGIAAGVGGAAMLGGQIYNSYQNAPISTASSYGSAMQGTLGREASAAYSGRSGIEMSFMKEKQQAIAMANAGVKGQRASDSINAVTNPLVSAAKYAAIGGIAGGIGGLGFGAIPGAIGGAAFGLGKGVYDSMGSGSGDRLMGMMGSSTFQNKYEAGMAKNFSGKYNESLQGLKDQNPFKTLAAENYQSNYGRNLDFQRQMGFSNSEFHGSGGYREGAINAGFTDDQAMGASSAIMGAGGSTRMAKDSKFALQAGRGLDMTNASQVLGQLSSSMGSSEGSKQAFVKMIAEGNRIGLDSSEYREESRKFMEATAGAVAKSGSGSMPDIERIIGQMGGFLADKTGRGIEAGKNAYDMYNNNTSQTSGARGTLRASAMMGDDVIGKMNPMDRASLSNINNDQLSEDDNRIKYLADKYGTSAKDLVGRTQSANKKSLNLTARGDSSQSKVTELRKQMAELGAGPENAAKRQELQQKIDMGLGEVGVAGTFENAALGADRKLSDAFSSGTTSPAGAMKTLTDEQVKSRMENKNTGRIEDESNAGAAEASRVVLENFKKFKDDLVPAATAVRAFNDQMQRMVEIAKSMPAKDRADLLGTIGSIYGAPQNQTQAGKKEK